MHKMGQDGFELCSNVVFKLDRAKNQGVLAKRLLNNLANELDEWRYNSAIAKVVRGSIGIGGALAGTNMSQYSYSYFS